jgi:hypothetical protein
MGWGFWENVLENKGTGEDAEMFIIRFVGAVFTERKKKKINEEKLDFNQIHLPTTFFGVHSYSLYYLWINKHIISHPH